MSNRKRQLLGDCYGKCFLRLSLVLSTLFTWLQYWPYISASRHCWFQRGVIFKPYYGVQGRLKLVLNGRNLIGHRTVFQGSAAVVFGEGSYCAGNCVFAANAGIQIGRNVMIADHVTLRDTDHCFADLSVPMIKQGFESRRIVVEDDVWIAHGVMLLKGVHVGHGSIIGAGAVVSKDIPAFAIVGGSPARILRFRNRSGGGSAEL